MIVSIQDSLTELSARLTVINRVYLALTEKVLEMTSVILLIHIKVIPARN